MVFQRIFLFFALAAIIFCFEGAWAAKVLKTKNRDVLIDTGGTQFKVGETLEVINQEGDQVGILLIKAIKKNRVIAFIKKGKARIGDIVERMAPPVATPSQASKGKPADSSNDSLRVASGLVVGSDFESSPFVFDLEYSQPIFRSDTYFKIGFLYWMGTEKSLETSLMNPYLGLGYQFHLSKSLTADLGAHVGGAIISYKASKEGSLVEEEETAVVVDAFFNCSYLLSDRFSVGLEGKAPSFISGEIKPKGIYSMLSFLLKF